MTLRGAAKARARAQAALTKAGDNLMNAKEAAARAKAFAAFLAAFTAAREADAEFNSAAQDYSKCLGISK